MAGDETALPAISRFLEEMQPGVSAFVFIEVESAEERRHLPAAANAAILWLLRDGLRAGTSDLLAPMLSRLAKPAGTVSAWIAGEIEVARSLRSQFIGQWGLQRDQIRGAGYWRAGIAGAHERIED